MNTSKKILGWLLPVFLLWGACGDDDDKNGKDDKKAKEKSKKGVVKRGSRDEGSPRKGAESFASRDDAAANTRAGSPRHQAGLAKGLRRWRPVNRFISSRVRDVAALGEGAVMALTDDNHVGVTTDGGKTWHFQKLLHGRARAVHGKKGGPYYAVGDDGFVARSGNGKTWRGLAMVTEEDLKDVVFAGKVAVAVSNRGTVLSYSGDAETPVVFNLPKTKRARSVMRLGKNPFLVLGRKEVWATRTGGKSWYPMQTPPELKDGRKVSTSQGICKLGRVARRRGMVCEVSGTGYGLSASEMGVVSGDTIQVSRDGGKTWRAAKAPFRRINSMAGYPGGPYFIAGGGGGLARSPDGSAWVVKSLGTNAQMEAIHIEGDRVVVVGRSGVVALSKDKGKTWRLVEVEPKKSFTHIVKKDGKLVLPVSGKPLVSSDGGESWAEVEDPTTLGELPAPLRPGKCPGDKPPAGVACKLSREVSSPANLPNMRIFDFQGDLGVVGGDQGLVAVTQNGGALWRGTFGADMRGGIQHLELAGGRVVVVGKRRVVVSTNGGESYNEALLPKKKGTLNRAFITSKGDAFIVGDRATLLKSVSGSLRVWKRLDTVARSSVSFVKVFEGGGALVCHRLPGRALPEWGQGKYLDRGTHPVESASSRTCDVGQAHLRCDGFVSWAPHVQGR